jgi:hypothetical protein
MKIWLDADRQPDVDWVWPKTVGCAIVLLSGGCVEKISFAPDQPDLVEPVVDWMIRHDSPARRAVHKPTAQARKPRHLLVVPVPVVVPESEAS